MKPTHLTVVIGNFAGLYAVGVGPEWRRVTVPLTPEQAERLALRDEKNETIHVTILEDLSKHTEPRP